MDVLAVPPAPPVAATPSPPPSSIAVWPPQARPPQAEPARSRGRTSKRGAERREAIMREMVPTRSGGASKYRGTRRRMRPVLLPSILATSVLALCACDRPSEPVATAPAKSKPARCVRKVGDEAPPPPPSGPDPRCPADADGGPPKVPTVTVAFVDAKSAPVLSAEVMATEAHRSRGLMFRKELPEERGMLFVFPDVDIRTFWMRNTCLPLDMLFVADDGFIAGIVENVPTMNDDGRTASCPVRYVLEVNAGFARRHGVKPGQRLKLSELARTTE